MDPMEAITKGAETSHITSLVEGDNALPPFSGCCLSELESKRKTRDAGKKRLQQRSQNRWVDGTTEKLEAMAASAIVDRIPELENRSSIKHPANDEPANTPVAATSGTRFGWTFIAAGGLFMEWRIGAVPNCLAVGLCRNAVEEATKKLKSTVCFIAEMVQYFAVADRILLQIYLDI